jgi:hypothetical protein
MHRIVVGERQPSRRSKWLLDAAHALNTHSGSAGEWLLVLVCHIAFVTFDSLSTPPTHSLVQLSSSLRGARVLHHELVSPHPNPHPAGLPTLVQPPPE